MNLLYDISLANYSTMGLGGKVSYLVEVNSKNDVKLAYDWAKTNKLPCLMIGLGSNIVWRDEGFKGLILVNKIGGYSVFQEDETEYYITIGAGENWDNSVKQTVEAGLTGIEALSLIPGKAGATPIQNVGAYGQEIADTLTTVEAYDSLKDDFVMIPASECGFGYRTSRFKTTDKGRFFITAITLHLRKANPMPPFYSSLNSYLETNKITTYTPEVIRNAVINIRSAKLPDPALVHNVGSFFANPIVNEDQLTYLNEHYSMVPHWPAGPGLIKLSAAWLIEQAGFKDMHDAETGMATWANQPLVLVNEKAKSSSDLLAFKQKIIESVMAKFSVALIQEPELLP